jgi:hypothetical protein
MLNKIKSVFMVGKIVVMRKSPEILLGAGCVGVVVSAVMACRATLKVETVLDEHSKNMDKIEYAKESKDIEGYSDTDAAKDKIIQYKNTVFSLVKLYSPALLVGSLSLGFIIGGHNILRKRNLALVGAYKSLETMFNKYRARVVEELGEDADRTFRYGTRSETRVEMLEDGTQKVTDIETVDNLSAYSVIFDEGNEHYSKQPGYNQMFIKTQEQYANDKMRVNGFIFLNEVYEMLGLPRTPEGQFVGWLASDEKRIDFARSKDFLESHERSTWIDFDVKVMYHLI